MTIVTHIAGALAAAAVGIGVVGAAGAGPGKGDPIEAARAPFKALRLAAELADEAQARNDPWNWVLAARLRLQSGAESVTRAPDGAVADALPAQDSVKLWLANAERQGEADPRILSLVADLRAQASKGRAGGPRMSSARLSAGARHSYSEPFVAGRPAVVYVEGDGDSRLGLSIVGPGGYSACRDDGPGDIKLCTWTPAATGAYRVQVNNAGPVAARYALGTN